MREGRYEDVFIYVPSVRKISLKEAIPVALDMAFGCAELKYVILGKDGITCKV